ncbi:MAG TPA: hypothetical protein VNZ45_03240 [Bacteroidia bacterium]|nr:hypothetical protein [Bacteroidia bacterium]
MNKKSVALFPNKRSVVKVITCAKHYVEQMTRNDNFPEPVPALSVVTEQIAQVQTAYTTALTQAKGTVNAMYGDLKVLEISLKQLTAYAESVTNKDVQRAEIIIISSGMTVKKDVQRTPVDKKGAILNQIVLSPIAQ